MKPPEQTKLNRAFLRNHSELAQTACQASYTRHSTLVPKISQFEDIGLVFLFFYSFIYLFIYLFNYLVIYLFIYLFIYLYMVLSGTNSQFKAE